MLRSGTWPVNYQRESTGGGYSPPRFRPQFPTAFAV